MSSNVNLPSPLRKIQKLPSTKTAARPFSPNQANQTTTSDSTQIPSQVSKCLLSSTQEHPLASRCPQSCLPVTPTKHNSAMITNHKSTLLQLLRVNSRTCSTVELPRGSLSGVLAHQAKTLKITILDVLIDELTHD